MIRIYRELGLGFVEYTSSISKLNFKSMVSRDHFLMVNYAHVAPMILPGFSQTIKIGYPLASQTLTFQTKKECETEKQEIIRERLKYYPNQGNMRELVSDSGIRNAYTVLGNFNIKKANIEFDRKQTHSSLLEKNIKLDITKFLYVENDQCDKHKLYVHTGSCIYTIQTSDNLQEIDSIYQLLKSYYS